MDSSTSAAERRSANRRALARKAAARRKRITKASLALAERDGTAIGSGEDDGGASTKATTGGRSSDRPDRAASRRRNRRADDGPSDRTGGGGSDAVVDALLDDGDRVGGGPEVGIDSPAPADRPADRPAEIVGPDPGGDELGADQPTGRAVDDRSPAGDRATRRPDHGRRLGGRLPVLGGRTSTTSTVRQAGPDRRSARKGAGGVAPFVPPTNRLGGMLVRRRWRRRGFVPLTPGRPRLRHRILPRTVIGISFMLLSFAVGAGFSGASFYAYYDNRLAENEATVARFVDGFDQQFTDAASAIDELRVGAVDDIRVELAPLGDYAATVNGVIGLPAAHGQSVFRLETDDESGRAVVGSAFAVAEHDEGTALVTSYTLVVASTTTPGPGIELVKDGERIPARLWSWDRSRDLAVVVVDRELPVLDLADTDAQVAAVGTTVFAMSGVGGQGATAVPGTLVDFSLDGLQHTVPTGSLFEGGPLLTAGGQVVGMATTSFRPLGVDPGPVGQAPGIPELCAEILDCPEPIDRGRVSVAADEAGGAPVPDELVEADADGGNDDEDPGPDGGAGG